MRHGLAAVTGLLLLLCTSLVTSKKEGPDYHETTLSSRPSNLFYFKDSDVVIVHDVLPGIIYRSTDAGATWQKANGVSEGESLEVIPHPYNNQVAVLLGTKLKHWITKDQGRSWESFTTQHMPVLGPNTISYHAQDANKIVLMTSSCTGLDCTGKAIYTTDGFQSQHALRERVLACRWAKGTEQFTTYSDQVDATRIMCVAEGKYSTWVKDQRLIITDDYFESEIEPAIDAGRTVPGILNLASVTGYITVAARSEGTSELALYVTDNTIEWHRAEFGDHALEEEAYTVLESTNYSIQVDVKTGSRMSEMGALFTSNSNGTYFTEIIKHTNRNMLGYVDFEKISNIQGIVLVNVVDNYENVEKSWLTDKNIISKISFDDGRDWMDMKVDGDILHLHSVTGQRNQGRIFSSPAPGIVMGVGNTGSKLKAWRDSDTYVSDDAGITWRLALKKPHMYEMGDQGAILVAVEDTETSLIKWSINHGKDWSEFDFGNKVRPVSLQTVPDSTSLKFIMVATKGSGIDQEHLLLAFDFAGLHEDKCTSSDFEKWPARVDSDGKATCIMGHKQFFRRRKAGAECFVDQEFIDPVPEFEDCACTDADYECDFNFVATADGGECQPAGAIVAPEGVCKDAKDTFKGSSGYRLIPGNTCDKKAGVAKDALIERPCTDSKKTPATGQISHELTVFKQASRILEYYYLERKGSGHGIDETVVMRTDRSEVYVTNDHGKTWARPLKDISEEIVAVYPHQYYSESLYLITTSRKVYYSHNRGKTFHHFEAPEAPNTKRLQILGFHPNEKDWLLWTGAKDCGGFGSDCHAVAHVSLKGGEEWTTLLPYVNKCQFVWREGRNDSEHLVYCEQHLNEDPSNTLALVASKDWFEHKETHFTDVISFATMSEFIIVALRDADSKTLRVDASIDGMTFANAQFPSNFHVPHQRAYTVLDSSTHAVFLHVTVNNLPEQEYGSIIKSNSNGTSYVLSVSSVNRNTAGYVDFEKMQGLEGVAIINTVSNTDAVDAGAVKKLKTMITHNDGAEWGFIEPPTKDSRDEKFECEDSVLEKCSLHLHGYTERKDARDTYSSPSAIGLMLGVGNVGPELTPYKDGDTFVTRDGGISWHEAFKGRYMWEYGDQGSLIVLVKEDEAVNNVQYSRDEGSTWQSYEFSDKKITINDITTVPSDTSRNFLLWGRDGSDPVTVNLDFTGLTDKQCNLNEVDADAADSDYTLWKPKHPLSDDDCLFGHVALYHRKKVDSNCFNGAEIRHLHNIERNCSCIRQDFECDYNYERQDDGSCKLVPGLDPPDHKALACTGEPGADEWYEPTGYRRIPLTTCQGGKEMEYTAARHACPGREEVVRKKHAISGAALFFAIFLPICAAAAVGWWVYRNWDGKFGRIQLGDGIAGFSGSSGGPGGMFDSESPLVKWPVAAASGLVAVIVALPSVVGAVWRAISSRLGSGGRDAYAYSRPYTTRDSFARDRTPGLAAVEDEGELLGEDSDEEV